MKQTVVENNIKVSNVTFGWELIMNLYDCNLTLISSKEKIKEYVDKLCALIEMKQFGETMILYFGHNEVHTKGYSLVQLIETSSITGHFSEAKRSAYLNIFSCKPYDEVKALEFTKKFFKAKETRHYYITRL